jgi:hypothetical protein
MFAATLPLPPTPALLVGAIRRDPEAIQSWRQGGRPVAGSSSIACMPIK